MSYTSHYIMIDSSESEHGEYGYLYKEVENPEVITPKEYILLEDETRTYRHLEVVNVNHVIEIPEETYSHLMTKVSNDDDITEDIQQILKHREERIKKLRVKREQFVTLAGELQELWQNTPYPETGLAGMDTNYPFELSFDEMVSKMMAWGYKE